MLRIVIVAEREGMTAVQPSEIGGAALRGGSHRDHGQLLKNVCSFEPQYRHARNWRQFAQSWLLCLQIEDNRLPKWAFHPMDKLASIRAFTRVVQQGSFAAAARELRLSRSAVSKYVIELEQELGAQLLVRTTRSARATENG